MDIFLLRHGDYNQNTLAQSLSQKGKKHIESIGIYLFQNAFSIEAIFSSPKPRAIESARIVAAAIGFASQGIIETPFLKPSASAEDIVSLVQNKSSRKALLFTGHLPSIAETASLLLSGKERPFVRFDTATLCHLRIDSFDPLESELISLIHPGTLPGEKNINL